MTTMTMNAAGQVTVPDELRRQLGWDEAVELVIEVTEEGQALTLRPTNTADEEDDSWAQRPDVRASIERALADSRAGRVRQLTETELRQLAEIED